MKSPSVLLCFVTVCSSCSVLFLLAKASLEEDCCFSVDSTKRQFVDTLGRSRLFHGVNVVYKSFPFHPQNDSFDPQLSLSKEDVSFLVENGMNVVRLYVAWPGVEPSKGEFNMTYLEVLADFVEMLGSAGIYTILDCHQDIWSSKFCGEGAPDYAALYLNRTIKPYPFPIPIPSLTAFKVDPETGYPYRNDCNKHSFFTYYLSDAVSKSWQSLYDNEKQIQDHFALFWEKVAERFHDNKYVLAYELLNEPWVGDFYRHPDQLRPKTADSRNLMPMYKKLHASIRKYDTKHIIFFEPTTIITGVPIDGFANTGLTEGPGGPEFNNRQALSYHLYCIFIDSNGQPSNTRICGESNSVVMKIRDEDRKKLSVAGFVTEWGAYDDETVPGSHSYQDALDILALSDEYLQSWAYWQFKGYGDFTTQSSTEEGLWFPNGTVQTYKLNLLSRSYAMAVSGTYISQSFDTVSRAFNLSFAASLSTMSAPTIIYLNEKLNYPKGFNVSISPPESATHTQSHNFVLVTLSTGVCDQQVINVNIKATA